MNRSIGGRYIYLHLIDFVVNLGKLYMDLAGKDEFPFNLYVDMYAFVLSDVSIKSSYYRHKLVSYLCFQSYESFIQSICDTILLRQVLHP